MKTIESRNQFTAGYICACSNLKSMHGESTELTELLACNFSDIKSLRKAGVDEADITNLMPVIKEINRKRKLNQ